MNYCKKKKEKKEKEKKKKEICAWWLELSNVFNDRILLRYQMYNGIYMYIYINTRICVYSFIDPFLEKLISNKTHEFRNSKETSKLLTLEKRRWWKKKRNCFLFWLRTINRFSNIVWKKKKKYYLFPRVNFPNLLWIIENLSCAATNLTLSLTINKIPTLLEMSTN